MAKKVKIPVKEDTRQTSTQYGYQGNVRNQYGYSPADVDFYDDKDVVEKKDSRQSQVVDDSHEEKLYRLLFRISKKLKEEEEKEAVATSAKEPELKVPQTQAASDPDPLSAASPDTKTSAEPDEREAVVPVSALSPKKTEAKDLEEPQKTASPANDSRDSAAAPQATAEAAGGAKANATADSSKVEEKEAVNNTEASEESESEEKVDVAEQPVHAQTPANAPAAVNNSDKQDFAASASAQSKASGGAVEEKAAPAEELPEPEKKAAVGGGSGGRVIDMADASMDGGPERVEEENSALDKKEKTHLEGHSKAKAAQAGSKIGGLSTNQKKKEDATTKLDKTKDAVVEKTSEKEAEVNAGQVGKVAEAETPEVNKDEAKSTLNQSLQASLPQKVEDVDNFKDNRVASKIGDKVKAAIDAKAGEVTGTFEVLDKTPKPEEPRKSVPFSDIEQAPATPEINAGNNLIPKVDEKSIDLNSYLTESDNLLKKEGIKQEHLDLVDSGDLFEAKKIQKDIDKKAKEEPGNLRSEEKELHGKNEAELQKKEADEKGKMEKERAAGLGSARGSQVGTKGSLEDKKKEVTDHINKIYEDVNKQVQDKLTKLKTDSLAAFDREEAAASSAFENNVNTKMDKFKDERYSGVGGKFNKVRDWFLGIDDLPEVKQIFEEEKAIYITRIDGAISKIINDSQKVIDECKTLIANARKEIDEYVKGLSPALQKIGEEAEKEIKKKLDELDEKVNKAAEELKEALAKKRAEAIANIDKKIEKMKEEMSGFLSKMGDLLVDAALKFFKWALETAGHSADEIMGIINKGKAVLTAVVSDPIQFLKNLAAAVGGGVKNFGANIMKHLGEGFMNWLTGQLNSLPIQLPEKFDLKGIVSLTLQVLGLTYASLRNKLSNKVGEDKVQMAETGVEMMMEVKEKGPIAMYDMMADKADSIKNEFIEGAKEWAITNLIKQGLIRLATMINPAGAIVQAVLGIYNGVIFLVNNWDRILAFVNSVFDSIAAIASGAISQASAFVEKTMAQTIPLILDFIAQQLNLSGIAERITKIIHRIRKPIDQVIDKVIDWITKKVKMIADKLLGKDKKKPGEQDNPHKKDKKLTDKEVGADISFSADGHGHHLWIDVNGNTAEVMVASTPIAVVSLLDKWKKQINKLPDDKKGLAQGLIAQAHSKYQETKKDATATIPLLNEAQRTPERVDVAEKADNETEAAQKSLKVFLTQLFEIFGDEDGVMERFKDQIQNVDPKAKFEILEAIERNSEQLKTITSWDALVDKIKTLTPSVKRLYESPMGSELHEYGKKIKFQQASNAFNTALNQSTKAEEKKTELRAEKDEWIENRTPIIHGGTTDKAKLAKDSMLEQITNKNQQGNTTGQLTGYFAESMKGNSTEEHDKYKPKNLVVKAENQTLIVTYDYIVEIEGKEEVRKFTSTISLFELNGKALISQSTSGTNLVLKMPNTRGKTESVNQDEANDKIKGIAKEKIGFDAAHILADMFLGSGYKEALNLVTTSDLYNREIMKKAENNIKSDLRDVEEDAKASNPDNFISFDLSVTAKYHELVGNDLVNALKKTNGGMEKKDIDGVYELFKRSSEPKLCEDVTYKVDAIYLNGESKIANSIMPQSIGPDLTLNGILINS